MLPHLESAVYYYYYYYYNCFTALFLGLAGWAGAGRELLDFMVQGKINRGRHTDHPAGCRSIQTNQCPPAPSPIFFTGRMPFLPPNQQCQSTEGNSNLLCSVNRIAQNINPLSSSVDPTSRIYTDKTMIEELLAWNMYVPLFMSHPVFLFIRVHS